MTLREAIEQARAGGGFDAVVAAVPYFRFLGLQVGADAGGPICSLTPDPKLIGNPFLQAYHGGTVGALLEAASIVILMVGRESERVPRTVDLSVDYLRSARGALPVHARGIVTKLGRRVANVRAEAWQDDPAKPVATAHGHFLLT